MGSGDHGGTSSVGFAATFPKRGRLHGLPPAFPRNTGLSPALRGKLFVSCPKAIMLQSHSTDREDHVSLPLRGAWSARKTVRRTAFGERRTAAPDGGATDEVVRPAHKSK